MSAPQAACHAEEQTDDHLLHSSAAHALCADAHHELQPLASPAEQMRDLAAAGPQALGVFADCMDDDEDEALFAAAAAVAERPRPYTAHGFQSAAQMLEGLGQRQPSRAPGTGSTPRTCHAAMQSNAPPGWPGAYIAAATDAATAMPQPTASHDDGHQALEVVFADEDSCAAAPTAACSGSAAGNVSKTAGDHGGQEPCMQDKVDACRTRRVSGAFDLLDIIDYEEDMEAQQGSSPHGCLDLQEACSAHSCGAAMGSDGIVFMDEDAQMEGPEGPLEFMAHADTAQQGDAARTAGEKLGGSGGHQRSTHAWQAAMHVDEELHLGDEQIVYADEDPLYEGAVTGSPASTDHDIVYAESSPVESHQAAPPLTAGAPGLCAEDHPAEPSSMQDAGEDCSSHARPQQQAQRKRKKDELMDTMIQVGGPVSSTHKKSRSC